MDFATNIQECFLVVISIHTVSEIVEHPRQASDMLLITSSLRHCISGMIIFFCLWSQYNLDKSS